MGEPFTVIAVVVVYYQDTVSFDSVTCKMLVPGCSNINNELEPMKSQKMEPRIDGSHAGFGGGVGCYEGNRIYVCRNIETGEVDGR